MLAQMINMAPEIPNIFGLSPAVYYSLRDLVIPFLAPLLALCSAYIFFYHLPNRQRTRQLALELFRTFMSEEMRQSRSDVWFYFVAEPDAAEKEKRWKAFIEYATQPLASAGITPTQLTTFQRTAHVLEFFALIELCLRDKSVDPHMIREALGYYYIWWKDELQKPLVQNSGLPQQPSMKTHMIWAQKFPHLDALCAD